MSGVLIDIPQIAYQTWCITIHDDKGNRMIDEERKLQESLRQYAYSKDHKHVRC